MRSPTVSRDQITSTYELIRPYLRRTPMLEIEAADLELSGRPIAFKLEFLQHAGSFKPRGAFANLLSRPVPDSGVVAASGGNHGLAVAYAAHKLGITATIFVPNVCAATKQERIRSLAANLAANLVIAGERYADALEASRRFAAQSAALEIHAFDQIETLRGQGSVGLEMEQAADRHPPDRRRWRRPPGRCCGLVRRQSETHCGRAARRADSVPRAGSRAAGGCRGRRNCRRLACAQPGLGGAYVPEADERVGVILCGANTDAVRF